MNKDNLTNELLEAIEEILYLEEKYGDTDVIDKIIKLLEDKYDI